MLWLLACVVVAVGVLLALTVRHKWIRPWTELEQLVRQIGRGEMPRTFLIGGGPQARRVGVVLEELSLRQQQLDRQIAERESGTQTILSAMEDGLLVVDSRRRVTLINDAFRKMTGISKVEMGEPFLEVFREPTVDRVIEKALRTNQSAETEISLDEPPRQIQVSAVPLKNGGGAVALFHDITNLKNVDRMRSDFVANVSHELRTPLSILRGYIETLLEDPKTSPEELRRILEVMERHSNRLGLLLEDLLTLAQLESTTPHLQFSDVKIDQLIPGVARDWEKKFAKKNLKAVVDLAPALPTIHADETRLHEVLYNLLDNATKYSQDGGEIRLHAEQRDDDVIVSVADTGTGITRDELPRIFERFYRTDKARSRELGGTGLGLAIVKHIVQLHGGHVEAESEMGKGTTVRVVLPVNGAQAGAKTEISATPPPVLDGY